MKKKLLIVIAIILAMAMVFGACNSGNKTPAAEPASEPESTATEPSDESAEPVFADKPEVSLLLTQHDPDGSLPGQYCHAWAEMVYQKSYGRIEVLVNNGGSLAGPTESLDKVKDGSVDLAWGLQSFYSGQFPMTDGLQLPYLPYTSSTQASKVVWDIWENTDLLKSDTGYEGTKVILIRSNCDAPITTYKKKLESVADLKGLTIRASVAPMVDWLATFGATGKGCPITELFQNLQNGAFDGALTDWHGIYSFRLYDNCAKYFADEQVQYATYYFLMNEAKYNSLPDDLKAVIDECSGQAALELMLNEWDGMKDKTTAEITDNGGEVYKLPDQEHAKLVDSAATIREQWAASSDARQQLLDKINELVAKY